MILNSLKKSYSLKKEGVTLEIVSNSNGSKALIVVFKNGSFQIGLKEGNIWIFQFIEIFKDEHNVLIIFTKENKKTKVTLPRVTLHESLDKLFSYRGVGQNLPYYGIGKPIKKGIVARMPLPAGAFL